LSEDKLFLFLLAVYNFFFNLIFVLFLIL